MIAAPFPSTEFTQSAPTIQCEVSPRKLDLVRLNEISGVLASIGKVNPDGEPLSDPRIVELTYMKSFPKPAVDKPGGRLWYRTDVLKWGQEWDQRSGWPAGKPRPPRNGP